MKAAIFMLTIVILILSITLGFLIFKLEYKPSELPEETAALGLFLEQAVEAIGTFTASHKIKVKINGTEYWLQLDAV